MEKTQKCVKEMMETLSLPLPNEERPGLVGLKFDLLRSLVSEEAEEFDDAMMWLEAAGKELSRNHMEPEMVRRLEGVDDDLATALMDMSGVEFYQAATIYWWAEVIDAIADITVVIHNTSNAMGIDIEPFFDEVHRTNMQKADGPLREDGKRLKPLDWKPPRIEKMLRNLLISHGAKL